MWQSKAFKTRDSALAYFVNQLDNLDRRLYEPLYDVTWSRDIKLRSGITMSNESTSFIQSTIGAGGSLSNAPGTNAGGSIPWISAETTAIPGVTVNGQRIVTPLRLAAREICYSSVELDRSQLLGQPLDVQQMAAMNITYQMNVDQMVYIGDSTVGATGLVNGASIASGNVATGVGGGTQWAGKTADEILADVNTLLNATWQASGFAVCPSDLLLPPAQFSYITSQKVSSAGNVSILKFLKENSISLAVNGKELDIKPVKWLTGRGQGATNRMVAYTNDEIRVRYPMVPIRRETVYYQGIKFHAPYLWALGEMEFVYPETIRYADGI